MPITVLHPNTEQVASFSPQDEAVQFANLIESLGLNAAIKNVITQLQLIEMDGQAVPCTINRTEYDNSYVCSPFTAYISYAKDELGLLENPLLETGLKGAIGLASGALKLAKINQTVSLNNWLVSTNLVPDWSTEALKNTQQQLTTTYPDYSLSIRSLNQISNADLMQRLEQQGWLMIPARQVYLFDNKETHWWKRNNCKNDQRLLRKTTLHYTDNSSFSSEDFLQMETCFNQLFIEKHSPYNPQFTAAFFKELHQAGLVDFHGFRNASGTLIGFIGLFTQQKTITTPMLGYDTRLPRSLGLYRLLMAVLLKKTYESGLMMNLSSGAAGFKRQRGGIPTIEYTAFYVKHLPAKRRWALQQFAKVLNQYAPKMFEKHQI